MSYLILLAQRHAYDRTSNKSRIFDTSAIVFHGSLV